MIRAINNLHLDLFGLVESFCMRIQIMCIKVQRTNLLGADSLTTHELEAQTEDALLIPSCIEDFQRHLNNSSRQACT